MTIIIGQTLPESVLLVADGKTTMIFTEGESSDSNKKIQVVSDYLLCATAGITMVSDMAKGILLNQVDKRDTPEIVLHKVRSALSNAWEHYEKLFASDVDRTHPRMKATLLVGGLSEATPYLIGNVVDARGLGKPSLLIGPNRRLSIGGEEHDSSAVIESHLYAPLTFFQWTDDGPVNGLLAGVISGLDAAIAQISKVDMTIGGQVHYGLLRNGFDATQGLANRHSA